MNYTLISPRLAIQKGDFLGSGVPYWPVELAILASYLKDRGNKLHIMDLFGNDPTNLEDAGDFYWQGKKFEIEKLKPSDVFIIYAISYMSHEDVKNIARKIKVKFPISKILILENSQAVTGYSIEDLAEDFFSVPIDGLLIGEVYSNFSAIEKAVLSGDAPPSNLLTPQQKTGKRLFAKLEKYPRPLWELFNLKNYWALPYSHGPKTGKYLPLLTSRGCPYPCNFCVVPSTNEKKWRGRSPEEVVEEMLILRDLLGVRHFQIEDLNPTVQKDRWPKISEILKDRDAGIFYYFVSGTKAETVRIEDVPLLAAGGCRYISISPESGSEKVMKNIGKPFNYEHGLKLVEACHDNGIFTQACFLVGHPNENGSDHEASKKYLRELVRAGLDEAAIFVVAPFAGSQLFRDNSIPLKNKSGLVSFSPKGREDWATVEKRRSELIRLFFLEKLRRGPALWAQGLRSIFGRPSTKMENLPKRILFISKLLVKKYLAPF